MTLQELMDRNYEQGLEFGRSEGLEQGLEQGRAEGEAAGRTAAIMDLARSMKAEGLSEAIISKTTGLSVVEIEGL